MGGGGKDAVAIATVETAIGCSDHVRVPGWLEETSRDIPSIGGTRRVVGTTLARDSDIICLVGGEVMGGAVHESSVIEF
jgi:hypothetical protein